MIYPNDHALLDHARHVLRHRRAQAQHASLLAAARAERGRFDPLRAALAARLGSVARLLAAIAEDLDPTTAHRRMAAPLAPRRG